VLSLLAFVATFSIWEIINFPDKFIARYSRWKWLVATKKIISTTTSCTPLIPDFTPIHIKHIRIREFSIVNCSHYIIVLLTIVGTNCIYGTVVNYRGKNRKVINYCWRQKRIFYMFLRKFVRIKSNFPSLNDCELLWSRWKTSILILFGANILLSNLIPTKLQGPLSRINLVQ